MSSIFIARVMRTLVGQGYELLKAPSRVLVEHQVQTAVARPSM